VCRYLPQHKYRLSSWKGSQLSSQLLGSFRVLLPMALARLVLLLLFPFFALFFDHGCPSRHGFVPLCAHGSPALRSFVLPPPPSSVFSHSRGKTRPPFSRFLGPPSMDPMFGYLPSSFPRFVGFLSYEHRRPSPCDLFSDLVDGACARFSGFLSREILLEVFCFCTGTTASLFFSTPS